MNSCYSISNPGEDISCKKGRDARHLTYKYIHQGFWPHLGLSIMFKRHYFFSCQSIFVDVLEK